MVGFGVFLGGGSSLLLRQGLKFPRLVWNSCTQRILPPQPPKELGPQSLAQIQPIVLNADFARLSKI